MKELIEKYKNRILRCQKQMEETNDRDKYLIEKGKIIVYNLVIEDLKEYHERTN